MEEENYPDEPPYKCPNPDCNSQTFERGKLIREKVKTNKKGKVSSAKQTYSFITNVHCEECGEIIYED